LPDIAHIVTIVYMFTVSVRHTMGIKTRIKSFDVKFFKVYLNQLLPQLLLKDIAVSPQDGVNLLYPVEPENTGAIIK